jgi:hypothetical protein
VSEPERAPHVVDRLRPRFQSADDERLGVCDLRESVEPVRFHGSSPPFAGSWFRFSVRSVRCEEPSEFRRRFGCKFSEDAVFVVGCDGRLDTGRITGFHDHPLPLRASLSPAFFPFSISYSYP